MKYATHERRAALTRARRVAPALPTPARHGAPAGPQGRGADAVGQSRVVDELVAIALEPFDEVVAAHLLGVRRELVVPAQDLVALVIMPKSTHGMTMVGQVAARVVVV